MGFIIAGICILLATAHLIAFGKYIDGEDYAISAFVTFPVIVLLVISVLILIGQ